MAKRARKPQDPRTPEEVAAQPRKKGLKQPGITGARKKVAEVKKEKAAKGAAIEAAVAPRRKKSSPSAPKTTARVDAGPLDLDRPEPAKPAPREKAEDVPEVRQAEKRRQEKGRLAQIGKPESLTTAEQLAMQEIKYTTPTQKIEKEKPLPADSLRPKQTPLPDEVRNPFASTGGYTFPGPKPIAGSDTPAKNVQSTQLSNKVGKDLARRVSRGLGLPGQKNDIDRALEIAQADHARQVERGMADPNNPPSRETLLTHHADVITGHPMRQAVVERLYNADEEKLRGFASAKEMSLHETVHGLFRLSQQNEEAQARVKLDDKKRPMLYDPKQEAPGRAFDVDFKSYLMGEVHKPKPHAITNELEGRKKTHLVARNIVEEISGAKSSGRYSGKAKGGVIPFGPQPLDPKLTDKDGVPQPARSGYGSNRPEAVKDLPVKPGKKPKAIGGQKDSQGGLVPTPTPLQKVVRSNRGRRATGASSETYRLYEPSALQKEELRTMESMNTPPSTRFVAKEQEKQRKSKGKLAMAVRSGDDKAIQDAAWKHRGAQFTQTTFEGMENPASFQLNPVESTRTVRSDDTGKRVLDSKKLPKPEKAKEVLKELPYSGFTGAMDRPQFATSVAQPKTVTYKRTPKLAPYPEKVNIESDGSKIVTGQGGSSRGGYEQPFLVPAMSEAKLKERFPADFDTSGGKRKKTWNPMSRQFLGGKEVKVSKQTTALQQEASKARGSKDTPYEPPKSDAANIAKA
jgi:hypothetical protein